MAAGTPRISSGLTATQRVAAVVGAGPAETLDCGGGDWDASKVHGLAPFCWLDIGAASALRAFRLLRSLLAFFGGTGRPELNWRNLVSSLSRAVPVPFDNDADRSMAAWRLRSGSRSDAKRQQRTEERLQHAGPPSR
jgi:hypothetical protein